MVNTWLSSNPFLVSREIGELIVAAANVLPPFTVSDDLFVEPVGYVYFENLVATPHGWVGGFLWGKTGESLMGQGTTYYVYPLVSPMFGDRVKAPGHSPSLHPFLQEDRQHATLLERYRTLLFVNGELWFFPGFDWRTTEQEISHIERGKEILAAESVSQVRHYSSLFLSFLLFLQQKLLVPERVKVSGSRKVRDVGVKIHEPKVNVVRLRKTHQRSSDDHEHKHFDYSCRWFVRGHWHRYFHKTEDAWIPHWINTYLKGPDDKPVKPPNETVFAVVR
tara:strand:+ start:1821 stop:2654 length:834 start_codon:yes stop_codon:yes gene_type:complete